MEEVILSCLHAAGVGRSRAFATASDDSSAKLWDTRCWAEVNDFRGEKVLWGVTSVAFSGSGR